MPRNSRDISLVYRSNRKKLLIEPEPHWHRVAEGQHLGYRKTGETQGTWVARYRVSGQSARRYRALGTADDTVPANGTHVFSFQQAQEAAQKWFAEIAKEDAAGFQIGPYTVEDAAQAWLSAWEGSERGKANAKGNLKHHILPVLGSLPLKELRREQVHEWLQKLAVKPPVRHAQHLASPRKLAPSKRTRIKFDLSNPETQRRRRDTANRIFSDLSAMLTLAYDNGRCESKRAWETVPKFENVAVAKNEYLTEKEARAFIAACPPDFRLLVRAGLATGCRYMELATMTAAAYDRTIKAISVRQAKTGKVKHVFLTPDEAKFFAQAAAGKGREDLLFRQADGNPWVKSSQQSRMRSALRKAGISGMSDFTI